MKVEITEPLCILEMHRKTARKITGMHLDILIMKKNHPATSIPAIARELFLDKWIVRSVFGHYKQFGLDALLSNIAVAELPQPVRAGRRAKVLDIKESLEELQIHLLSVGDSEKRSIKILLAKKRNQHHTGAEIAYIVGCSAGVVTATLRSYADYGINILLQESAVYKLAYGGKKSNSGKIKLRLMADSVITDKLKRNAAYLCKYLSLGAHLAGLVLIHDGLERTIDMKTIVYAAQFGDPRWRRYLHGVLGAEYKQAA